jgi:acyl-CoA synthetase (NDP forming)
MTEHPLDPLLKPGSIALLGASAKPGSPGHNLSEMIFKSAYAGKVYAVNPGYDRIDEYPCYSDLASLPEIVDHVVLAVANERLQQALEDVIAHGARAATIYASCYLDNDTQPALKDRLTSRAQEAGIAICGGNGMGFYNVSDSLYAGIFPKPITVQKGGISYIAQSGSAFTTLPHNGRRLGFNLCVSSGNEMVTNVSDYMDWSIAQQDTRVIALFLEAVRNPSGFVSALTKAVEKSIPVVVLKIGKTPQSAEMALSHTGAIAGNHDSFRALFKRYGVIEVEDFDEMAATLMMLQSKRQAGPGKLAGMLESGGFRELITDTAHGLEIDFAQLEPNSLEQIQTYLDPGLKAENPLDAWGTHDRFEQRFLSCLNLLMADPNVAAGIFFSNFRDGYFISEAVYRVMKKASLETDKPIAMVNCYSDLAHDSLCKRTTDCGFPLIDGSREALLALRHLFAYRDFRASLKLPNNLASVDAAKIKNWRNRLSGSDTGVLNEVDTLALLADFSIAVPRHRAVNNEHDLLKTASELGYPLVLKTAVVGITHKTEVDGVVVNIQNEIELLDCYNDVSRRLGAEVLLAEMIENGTELGIGVVNDPQFGPMIMVAAGGVLIELISEYTVALAPVSAVEANAMLSSLKLSKLIDGVRGKSPGNRQALIDLIVSLSMIAFELKDQVREIDLNPVIVTPQSAIAVDGLLVCSS